MLDLKEERKYDELRRLAQELHIPMPEAFIEMEVRDKYGYVIQRHKQRSHSWVRNAYNTLLCQMAFKGLDAGIDEYGAGYLSIKVTDGTIKRGASRFHVTIGDRAQWEEVGYGYRGNVAVDTAGIVVGSGTNAESFEDYALQTQIAEGAGGGQLNHVAMPALGSSYGALTWTITWERYFNNNSGGSIDVNEVAIYTKGYMEAQQEQFVMSRDKLAGTVAVPDTGQLKVTYTIQLTYPS